MSSQPLSPFGPQVPPPSAPRPRLATLHATGDLVDARRHVEPGTSPAVALAMGGALLGVVLLVFLMSGQFMTEHPRGGAANVGTAVVAQLLGLGFMALMWFVPTLVAARRARLILRGSALRAGPRQFPEIHACAGEFARRLGLRAIPEIYVLDSGSVNAFALKSNKTSMIVLTDETVASCLEGRSPGALAFVLGHEMAHLALGHTRWWRRPLRHFKKLSRLDECSADNVACELVDSFASAVDGVLLLTAGPRLLSFVDRPSALDQAVELASDSALASAERQLTHPLTMHRLARVGKRFAREPRLRKAA